MNDSEILCEIQRFCENQIAGIHKVEDNIHKHLKNLDFIDKTLKVDQTLTELLEIGQCELHVYLNVLNKIKDLKGEQQ